MTKDLLSIIAVSGWAGHIQGCQRQEEDTISVLKYFVL